MRLASSTSCAAVSRSTLPMSFRKSCSESVVTSRDSSSADAFLSRPILERLGFEPVGHIHMLLDEFGKREA
jgi:hypothetical protein